MRAIKIDAVGIGGGTPLGTPSVTPMTMTLRGQIRAGALQTG